MVSLKVQMKRGGTMTLQADGRCYKDSDGAGDHWEGVEDLTLFWPSKPKDKKRYPVREDLIADWKIVEEDYWTATERT